MTPANKPPLALDPGREDAPVHVPARPAAERPRALRQPADRGGDRRDAGGRDRRRRAAGAALRGRAGARRPRRRRELRSARGRGRPSRRSCARGDVEAGLAAAAQRIEATYETPAQYHNAMEPHAIVAAWDGDRLSIDTPSQGLAMAQGRIAGLFGIAPENIHIRSPFLGGGFGSKGLISGPQMLGIMAAKLVGRPVKLVLRREQMYGPVGHRAADAADAAPGRRRRRRADRDRPSHQDGVEHVRRFLRAGLRRLAHALRQPGHRDLARGGAARHRHAAVHARARRGDRLDRARKRDRRDGARPAAWTRSRSA